MGPCLLSDICDQLCAERCVKQATLQLRDTVLRKPLNDIRGGHRISFLLLSRPPLAGLHLGHWEVSKSIFISHGKRRLVQEN